MRSLFGVLRYEFRMSIQRRAILFVILAFAVFFVYLILGSGLDAESYSEGGQNLLVDAGQVIFLLNLFFPVVVGISSADRAIRDTQLGVEELLRSTRLGNVSYVLGKYLGVALSMLTVELLIVTLLSALMVLVLKLPVVFIAYTLLAVFLLSAPAIFFVVAFSVFCPLFMPVRVYQILFTGYWYWGNYLNPEVLPTISQTLLNASGKYARQAFLGVYDSVSFSNATAIEAVANIAILLFCAGLAIMAMIVYIGYRQRRR